MHLYTATQPVATNSDDSAAELTSADIDPDTYPLIAQHWFGVEPPCAIGQIHTTTPTSLRRHRQFEHVHRLGPRAIEELAVEIANGEDLDRALSAYDRLTTEMLKATGGALTTTKVAERSERELLKAWAEQLEARP